VCCRWQLEKSKTALKVVPLCVGLASSVPCTRLRIDETGTYLAVGASDGVVAVLGANDLRTVASYPCHDLPVTGMWFAPPALAHTLGKELDHSAVFCMDLNSYFNADLICICFSLGMKTIITTCSADRKLSVVKVGGENIHLLFSLCQTPLTQVVLCFH
jgi:hypothetical protein